MITPDSFYTQKFQHLCANGKHARWWSHVYGSGVHNLDIVCHAWKENMINADVLSRNHVPQIFPELEMVTDVQVASVASIDCSKLLQLFPNSVKVPDGT